MTRQDIRNRVVEKMLRKRVIKSSKRQVDTVAGWFSSSEQGNVKDEMEKMASDANCPLFKYGGGARDNVHLSGAKSAVKYLDNHGGDIPFGFDEYLD